MSVELKVERFIIVGLFVLITLVASHYIGPILGAAMLIPMFLAVMLLGNARALVMTYLGWSSVMALVADYTKRLDYADEGLLVLCCAVLFMQFVRFRRKDPDLKQMNKLFSFVLLAALASSFLNSVSPVVSFHYYISYLSFIPVFLLAKKNVRPGDSKKMFFLMIGFFILQVVLNVGWALHLNPIRNRVYLKSGVAILSDFAIGTLMGCNHVAYFAMMVLFLAYNYFMNPFQKGSGRIFAVFAAIVFFQIYLSDSAHVYPMLALAGILHLLFVRRSSKEILAICAAGALFFGVFSTYDTYRSGKTGGAYSQTEMMAYENVSRRIKKLGENPKGILTADILKRTPRVGLMKSILGEGPGNVLSTVAMSRVTDEAKAYLGQFYFTASGLQMLSTHSIMEQPVSGFIALLAELGVLGTGLYIAIYVYAFRRILRQVRAGLYKERYQYILAASFPVVLSVWGMMNVLTEMLYVDFFQIGIWIWAALVWTPMNPENLNGGSPESDGEAPGLFPRRQWNPEIRKIH